MKRTLILALALAGLAACAAPVSEAPPAPRAAGTPQTAIIAQSAYGSWLNNLKQEAAAKGISTATIHEALDSAVPDERVVELDQEQPETTVTFDAYNRRILSGDRVSYGAAMMHQYSRLLDRISSRYGVPSQIIVALWGMESNYGRYSGSYSTIDSLLTLAYEGRRTDFFRSELLDALRIVDQDHIPPSSMVGSWAGAMGQCQFMPSTYLRYAVDYDNGGQRNIWQDPSDVFASIANYLSAEGWRRGETWGREVDVNAAIASSETGLDHSRSMAAWRAMGVRTLQGKPLPDRGLQASLIQPDGSDGRSFLVYDNFRALMRWNRSTYFAVTVGQLADRIAEYND